MQKGLQHFLDCRAEQSRLLYSCRVPVPLECFPDDYSINDTYNGVDERDLPYFKQCSNIFTTWSISGLLIRARSDTVSNSRAVCFQIEVCNV